ncbi:Profilin/allergen [Ascodesmis nigricans]|uniref:Profilin n=1 Tax=Ascodesmis nigricans TaxID=341454 RepID=A0A4S2MKE1_9PEZI|nr:Profilin/allergen [Ascodesmis nigricans]
MSWQGYVDQSLIGTGKIDAAAIFSAAGDSVWAASAGFTIKPEEVKALIDGMNAKEPANNNGTWVNPLAAHGFHVNGVKYFTLKSDDRSVYGKQGKVGIVVVRTKQAILIAHYPENTQPGEAAKITEQLADYLIGVGY